jgi:uncharacterized protein
VAHPLRFNTMDLLRRPGTERVVDVTAEVVELGVADERFDLHAPVGIHLRLESLTDGIVVSGTVRAPWQGICRRCAAPTGGEIVCEIHELYQEVVTDPDAFELVGDQLDLAPMVGEVLVLDAPSSPLCRPDCKGLCPVCGIDRNVESCECVVGESDPRWAALNQLKGDLED